MSIFVFSWDPCHNPPQTINILNNENERKITFVCFMSTLSKSMLESAETKQKRSWVHCSNCKNIQVYNHLIFLDLLKPIVVTSFLAICLARSAPGLRCPVSLTMLSLTSVTLLFPKLLPMAVPTKAPVPTASVLRAIRPVI